MLCTLNTVPGIVPYEREMAKVKGNGGVPVYNDRNCHANVAYI